MLIFKIKWYVIYKLKAYFRSRNKNIEYILRDFPNYYLKENPINKKNKIFILNCDILKKCYYLLERTPRKVYFKFAFPIPILV